MYEGIVRRQGEVYHPGMHGIWTVSRVKKKRREYFHTIV